MTYSVHRPTGFQGQGDSRLLQTVRQLQRALSKTQSDFAHDSLRLPPDALGELAGILVDFAEDLHNDIGILEGVRGGSEEAGVHHARRDDGVP